MAAATAATLDARILWRPMTVDDLLTCRRSKRASTLAPWTEGNFRDALAAGYSIRVGMRYGASSRMAC